MIEIIDFTNCKLSKRNLEYAGRAGEKRGIIYNDELWFLKFPKNSEIKIFIKIAYISKIYS